MEKKNLQTRDITLEEIKNYSAQKRLEELGYKQELKRDLSVFGNVVMALSNVSPAMAVFVYALASFAAVGAVTVPSAMIQGINVVLIGFILAELGSMYPVSGGLYSIVKYVLPKPLVFIAMFMFIIQAFLYPPAIALGVGQYLQILFPGLPQGALACSVISAIALLLALLIGLNSIILNSRLAKIFLLLQLAVIGVFLVICFGNTQNSISDVVFNAQMLDADGGLTSMTFGAILMGVGIMCASIDGYPASLGFSEETKGSCRNVGKAVLITAIITASIIVLTIVMAVVAAPSLEEFISNPSPLLYTFQAYADPIWLTIVNVGIIISSFGCLVVLINYMARVIYTTARDNIWPAAINKQLVKVSQKSLTPWVATLVIALVNGVLVFSSSLVSLLTFGGMAAASVYLLIAIGSIRSRLTDKESIRPMKMPLFPIIPIIVIGILAMAIASQTPRDLMIVGGLLLVALIYYFAYYNRKKHDDEVDVNEK